MTNKIALTINEQELFERLTRSERPALQFWWVVLRKRSIKIPADKVIRIDYTATKGEYTYRLESKALSPKSISDGKAYERYALAVAAKKSLDRTANINPYFNNFR